MKARGLADPEGMFHQTIFLLVLSNEKATKFLSDRIFIAPKGGNSHGIFSPLEIIITQRKGISSLFLWIIVTVGSIQKKIYIFLTVKSASENCQ
jgi:hypothetical protein